MAEYPHALVLDFGGVISKTLFETHRETQAALGLPANSLTWRGPFAPETDDLWRAMQADEISERDYWTARAGQVGRLVGKDWSHMQEFVIAARSQKPMEIIRPQALQVIEKARQAGCKLAILSNELDLFYGSDFREKLPFLDDFDLIIDATYTKILKPDPRAYAFVTKGLGVAPEACVFVDDQQRNIDGASTFGMHVVPFDVCHPVDSYASVLKKLDINDLFEER